MLDVEFPQLLQDMIGDLTSAPEPVVIKLFAQDPELLTQWATTVGDTIKKIPGVVDVLNGIENTISGPARVFQCGSCRDRARRFLAAGSRTGRQRHPAGRAGRRPRGGERPLLHYPRALPRETRKTLDSIRNTMLVSGTGKTATHRLTGHMVEIPGQTEIRRENLQRDVQVTARFEGMNLGDGMGRCSRPSTT